MERIDQIKSRLGIENCISSEAVKFLTHFKTKAVHVSTIKQGDTIVHLDGHVRTVGKNNISTGLFGVCLFGNPYKSGSILVEKFLTHTGGLISL